MKIGKEITELSKTKIEEQEEAFKLLIEAVNSSTENYYELRKREIELLQQLFEAEKKISALIQQIAREKYGKECEAKK